MQKGWRCRLLGCRWDFTVEGTRLKWACARCGTGDMRQYDDTETPRRMAAVLNRGGPRPPTGFLAALGGTVHRRERE